MIVYGNRHIYNTTDTAPDGKHYDDDGETEGTGSLSQE
ncbi:hypothetical protein UFO1_2292 [Pelosinus sp. UFO1]|nr:hypothetical protein UFO1_2292 [Pelosinus sp. UFO1]